jgi:hypothetical protein
MDDKPNPGELYGGEDDSEDSLPGLALEPPSFYVAGFRRPQSRPQMGVAVYGIHHGNCDWLISSRGPHQDPADLSSNPRILDFMANVNDIRLGPDQKEKASYDFRDELAGFLGFSLTVPQDPDINTGTGICGILPATFYFTNLGGGLFSKRCSHRTWFSSRMLTCE